MLLNDAGSILTVNVFITCLGLINLMEKLFSHGQTKPATPGGGGGDDSAGHGTPTNPPPLGGVRPTVSCQRCCPQESTGAKGARRSMGTKAAQRKLFSTLHPSTIPKPNPDPKTPTHPQPTPNPTPTPNPSPKGKGG